MEILLNDLECMFTVREEPVEEDSEEEEQLKRKAKPSRKSLTGATFRSPGLSTRSTPARREISSQEDKTRETPVGRGRSKKSMLKEILQY